MNKLWRLTLDTNPEDCNLNCIMCEEHSKYSSYKQRLYKNTGIRNRRMPKNWIQKIFRQAHLLGVKQIIPSTMGEPLLYKYIDEFFFLAKKHYIKINLTTNGTFPGKNIEQWSRLIIPVTYDTKFSVNGATAKTAEKIMTGLNFKKQINNIRKFGQFRNKYYSKTGIYSKITFQLTFMQNNMNEIEQIIKLAADLDVDRIKGHHLWTHFPEIEHLSYKKNKNSIKKWNKIVDMAKNAIEKYIKPNGKKILLEQFNYLQENEPKEVPYEYDCPFLEKELWISATGKISPCCAPDSLRNKLGYFGNIKKNSLSEVLKSKKYNNLVKKYKNHYVCKHCIMRKPVK